MKLARPTIGVAVSVVVTGLIIMGYYFLFVEIESRFTRRVVASPTISSSSATTTQPETARSFKMLFVGDIMLGRHVGETIVKKSDWRWPFLKIADTLSKADIAFANLEGPVSSRGVRSGSIYSFRFDPRTVAGLSYAGFDVLSVANNHMWDYGQVALEDTLAHLESGGVSHVGAGIASSAYAPVFKTLPDGTRVGFLAYTEFLKSAQATDSRVGIAYSEPLRVADDAARARKQCDILVVSFHMGEEYQPTHHPRQESLFRAVIDAGADIIIGHHPHVVQEVEEYRPGKWIAYSLGNFVFDQNFSKETMEGLMIEATIQDKKITRVNKIPIGITEDHQAYLK